MGIIRHESLRFADLPGRLSANPLEGLGSAASARFVNLTRSPGRTAHRHPHSEEIVYVVSGSGHVWLDGEEHPVRAGDIVQIPIGAAHATVPDDGVDMQLMCFFPHPDLASNNEDTDIVVTPE